MIDWLDIALTPSRPENEITVLFDDAALTFSMPAATTLAELAGRLHEERGVLRRRMISVVVRLSREPGPPAS